MQELVCFQKANSLYMEYNKTLNFELLDSAMEECNRAIVIKSDFAEAYYLRALINIEFEEYEEKEEDLKSALTIFFDRLNLENTKEINYKIGLCYGKLNNDIEAIKFLENAIEIDKNYAEAYSELGYISYNSTPMRDNAIEYLNQAIKLNPDYAENYLWRGSYYEGLKDYDCAIADYSKGIELDNSNWQFYNYRGELYLFLKQWEIAISDYKLFRKFCPYKEKFEIELYDEEKFGPYLSLHFYKGDYDCSKVKRHFIEDIIMTPFYDILRNVNAKFDRYNDTSYSQSDVEEIYRLLSMRCDQLVMIETYEDFFAFMFDTGFIYEIIRNVDEIETNWRTIKEKVILLNKNLLNIFAKNIKDTMSLIVVGI